MSNPIIAPAPEASAFPNFTDEDWSKGGGMFSDAASTLTDAAGGNWASLGLDLVSDGLDALGFIADPFASLAAAPIGWIIEHVGFLKETLDQVAGDPEAVRTKAQTWTNIAAALDKSAKDYDASAKALASSFTGAAATAYTKAASNYSNAVKGASNHAQQASKAFEIAGAIVGTVRDTIRDMFSQFAAKVLERGLIALASSVETFGASIAAWTLDTVAEGAIVGERAAAKILKAVREVMELAHGASRSTRALKAAERDLLAGASRRSAAARDLTRANREAHAATSKADAAEDGIRRAQEAQARAQQHLAEATTPAQREAAENELRHAQQRETHHRDNLDEAHHDAAAAQAHRHEARGAQSEGSKHELSEGAEHRKKQIEYAHKGADTANEANDNVHDDERHEKARETADAGDDGSLV